MNTVKHFLGDGGTTDGKDHGDTRTSETESRDAHNAGYVTAIAAGVQSAKAWFNRFDREKLHGHRRLLADVLRGRMNFRGLVVGGCNTVARRRGRRPHHRPPRLQLPCRG